jgi:hypothetical protein
MKKIEEEWKTIEGFPDYEISNFGRCKSYKRYKQGRILKVHKICGKSEAYCYTLQKGEGEKTQISVGKLVARAFVENPNGYKLIKYFDGCYSNAIFCNIQWVSQYAERPKGGYANSNCVKKYETRENQLKNLREKIELAERFEKALLNGTEQEFIYVEIKELCRKRVEYKYGQKNRDFKEEMVSFVIDLISDRVSRGNALVSYECTINKGIVEFYNKYKQIQTVEFDERRM